MLKVFKSIHDEGGEIKDSEKSVRDSKTAK